MENYLVVLLLSVLVSLGAFYVHNIKQRKDQSKDEMDKVKEELEAMKNKLKQVNMVKLDLESTRNELNEEDVIAFLKETHNRYEHTLNELKKELRTQSPGFYVTLSSHPTLGQSQRIEFDQIITDVENNYDKISAVFTVPKDGLYHFSFTMFSNTGTLHAEIMQNNQVIGRNYGTSSGVSATINVVISCKLGDSIFVRHMTGRGTENTHGSGYTAFSGFLIN